MSSSKIKCVGRGPVKTNGTGWLRLLAALLPALLVSLALLCLATGSARAGTWEGFTPPEEIYGGQNLTENVPVRMHDGVTLYADVTRPADAEGNPVPGRFPVVIEQSCYGKDHIFGPNPAGKYARNGFVYVVADVRGTGASGGVFGVLDKQERRDGYQLVQWAARQSWSTGKVGLTGFSFMGAAANRTAVTNPPALKALYTGGSPNDIYREFMAEGGVWSKGSVMWNNLANFGSDPAGSFRERAMAGMDDGHLNWDNRLWRARSVNVTKIKVPTMVYTGWEDLFFRSTPRQYRSMKLAAGRKQLVIGPWVHYTFPKSVGPSNSYAMPDLEIAWFNRWLKGIRNGITRLGPVTLFDQGTDKWRRYSDWPPRSVRYRRFFLSAKKSGSAVSLNDGTLTGRVATKQQANGGLNDPDAGACSRSLSQYSAGTIPPTNPCNLDQRSEEAAALTYTTPRLPSDLHLNGPLALTLYGKSTAADPLWVARISDVTPEGTSVPVTQGSLLASRRALDPKRSRYAPNGDVVEPFYRQKPRMSHAPRPGSVHKYNVEILATDWVIRKGHRLRLTIAGADVAHFETSESTPDQIGNSTVLIGPNRRSRLTVGISK